MMNFSKEELQRYSRHLAIPEFGIEAQRRLKESSVLVIGAGGLGSPVLFYLAAAGVGKIGIVEYDRVDLSNLQRQILYDSNDLGKSKIAQAVQRINDINPYVEVEQYEIRLARENARGIIGQYDVVADGSDNFATRYLVNDACILENKPNVYGSVLRFEGQVSVFNFQYPDLTRGPNYRDLYPVPPPPGLVPNCAEAGVLGVLPGIIGSIQATEVIKVLCNIGEPLVGRMFVIEALGFQTRILKFKRNPNIKIDHLEDYEAICGNPILTEVLEILPGELRQIIEADPENIQLIDVREEWEYELDNLGALNIPLALIVEKVDLLDFTKKIIVHCQSGLRSRQAIDMIQQNRSGSDLYNLTGGIERWRQEFGNEPTA